MARLRSSFCLVLIGWLPWCALAEPPQVAIPAGSFPPFLKTAGKKEIQVDAFTLDREPVTKEEFRSFLRKNPEWRKSKVKAVFSDPHYLQDWKSDLDFGSSTPQSPVTFISWFAADAYCRSQNRELPSTDQWEYAAYDRGRNKSESTRQILDWYGQPNSEKLPKIGGTPNGYGVRDMFGLIWEWTLDFSSALGTDDGRDGTGDKNMFCGNAGQAATDPSDYAGFMRYSMRSSLKANYAVANVGFRCAKAAH